MSSSQALSSPNVVTIEIRRVQEISGPNHERREESATIRCTANAVNLSVRGTCVAIDLQPGRPDRPCSVPKAPGGDIDGAFEEDIATIEPIAEPLDSESAAAYWQMWAEAAEQIEPSILAWGCREAL